jgi:hypothetical protein
MEAHSFACPVPVLFLIHRRPSLAAQVLDAIRQARPACLLVAGDGPEDDHLCQQTRREVLQGIDWSCQVQTRFSQTQLRCRKAVSTAIDWAFAQHERVIVVEDDCLPDVSFFQFCAELLERYEGKEDVMQISGCNESGCAPSTGHSYCASRFPSIWAWASWRRAWRHHDASMHAWHDLRKTTAWAKTCRFRGEASWRRALYDSACSGQVDAWSPAWNFAQHARHGITLIPSINLVANLGWGPDALHTRDVDDPRSCMRSGQMTFPLHHPDLLKVDDAVDFAYFNRYCRKPSLIRRVTQKVRRLLGR